METIHTDIVEWLYSGHPDNKTFLNPGPPDVVVQMSLKQSRWCITATAERYGPSGPCSVDRTQRLRESFGHLQQDSENLEEGPIKDRVLDAHKEMSQAATHPLGHALLLLGARFNDLGQRGGTTWHPARLIARCHTTFGRLVLVLTQC